jgi:hypothetical protein
MPDIDGIWEYRRGFLLNASIELATIEGSLFPDEKRGAWTS